MLTTLVLGLLPACLGVAVLLLPSRTGWLGPARAIAVGAALAVVGAELLPAGVDVLGVSAVGLAAIGLVIPRVIDRLLSRARHGGTGGLALGFGALVVHQVSDGLQMGAARSLGVGVVLAIAAHGAPFVAAATLASARVVGSKRAAVRGGVLVAATAAGVVASGAVPPSTLQASAPVIGVVLAGLLVHAVTHGLDEDPPRTLTARAVEAGAFLAAVVGTLLLLHLSDPGSAQAPPRPFVAALVDLAAVGGVVVVLSTLAGRIRSLRALRGLEDVLLGAWLLGPAVGAAQLVAAAAGAGQASDGAPTPSRLPALIVGLFLGAGVTGIADPSGLQVSRFVVATAIVAVLLRAPAVLLIAPLAAIAPGPLARVVPVVVVAVSGLDRLVRLDAPRPLKRAIVVSLVIAAGVVLPMTPLGHPGVLGVALLVASITLALLHDGPRAFVGRLLPAAHGHATEAAPRSLDLSDAH